MKDPVEYLERNGSKESIEKYNDHDQNRIMKTVINQTYCWLLITTEVIN